MVIKASATFLTCFLVIFFNQAIAQDSQYSLEIYAGKGISWAEIEEVYISGDDSSNASYFLTEGNGKGASSLGILVGKSLGKNVFTILAGAEIQQIGAKYIFSSGHFLWNIEQEQWGIGSAETRTLDQTLIRLLFPVVIRADVGFGFSLSLSASPNINLSRKMDVWKETQEMLTDYQFEEDYGVGASFSLGLAKEINSKIALSVKWTVDFQRMDYISFRKDSVTVYPSYQSLQMSLHFKLCNL